MSSSHLPSFIFATTWSWMERRKAAVEVRASWMRSSPERAGPWPGRGGRGRGGAPDPGLVVGLAAGVVELEPLAADGDGEGVGVNVVGVDEGRGGEGAGA